MNKAVKVVKMVRKGSESYAKNGYYENTVSCGTNGS